MATERVSRRYEVLVRFAPDGTVKGAHQRDHSYIIDTDTGDVVEVGKPDRAVPLDPASVTDVIATHEADILAQVNTLAAERDDAVAARDEAIAERDDLAAQLAASKPPAKPTEVWLSQAIRGLRQDGWITADEAEAWAARTSLPALLEGVIAALPEAEQSDARVMAYSSTKLSRTSDLMVQATAAAMPDATPEERAAALEDSFGRWAQL